MGIELYKSPRTEKKGRVQHCGQTMIEGVLWTKSALENAPMPKIKGKFTISILNSLAKLMIKQDFLRKKMFEKIRN